MCFKTRQLHFDGSQQFLHNNNNNRQKSLRLWPASGCSFGLFSAEDLGTKVMLLNGVTARGWSLGVRRPEDHHGMDLAGRVVLAGLLELARGP